MNINRTSINFISGFVFCLMLCLAFIILTIYSISRSGYVLYSNIDYREFIIWIVAVVFNIYCFYQLVKVYKFERKAVRYFLRFFIFFALAYLIYLMLDDSKKDTYRLIMNVAFFVVSIERLYTLYDLTNTKVTVGD